MDDGDKQRAPGQRRPSRELTDELVLAAVHRAALHRATRGHAQMPPGATPRSTGAPPRGGAPPGGARATAPLREIRAHLGIAPRSAADTGLRMQVERLERQDMLVRGREHGVNVWTPTAAGLELLAAARARGEQPQLGESPQHAAWRRARMLARIEIGRFGADLRDTLDGCERMLEMLEGPPARAPGSDQWFALAERLRDDCRRLGSAQHCLREWQEPDDEHADIDVLADPGDDALGGRLAAVRARRAGRRNTRLWQARD